MHALDTQMLLISLSCNLQMSVPLKLSNTERGGLLLKKTNKNKQKTKLSREIALNLQKYKRKPESLPS